MAFVADHLSQAVDSALARSFRRLQPIDLPEGRVWLKRAERLSLRMRLQKGDPLRSLEAERRGLHLLADAGMPVPEVLAEGPEYLVLADLGPDLASLARSSKISAAQRLRAFAAAGTSLARLHRAGFSHGRPAPRDLCWDGKAVRFIDLEKFRARHGSLRWQALDLLVFVHACFVLMPDRRAEIDAALTAYEAAGGPAMAPARKLAGRLGWLGGLSRLALRLQPRSREIRAVTPALALLTG